VRSVALPQGAALEAVHDVSIMLSTPEAMTQLPGTRADVRGLSLAQQQALLQATFELLRPGQALDIRLDAEDELRRGIERRPPARFTWTRHGDSVSVRRSS